MSKSAARTTVRQLVTMTGGWTAFYDSDAARPQLVRRVIQTGAIVMDQLFSGNRRQAD